MSQYAESMVALVTGAGKGLGEAICELLMERGFSRVAVTARDRAEAVAVAARLGDKAKGFALDVTSDASVAGAWRAVVFTVSSLFVRLRVSEGGAGGVRSSGGLSGQQRRVALRQRRSLL